MAERKERNQITVRFDSDTYQLVNLLAAVNGLSMSKYAELAVTEQMKKDIDAGYVDDLMAQVEQFRSRPPSRETPTPPQDRK